MMVGKIQGGRLGGHGQGTQDVTLSSKGRVIWDAKPVNEFCDKGRHPPALQPKHDEVARLMVWWQTRYPNTPILIPKRTCRTLSSGSQSGKGHSPVRCRSPRRRVRGPRKEHHGALRQPDLWMDRSSRRVHALCFADQIGSQYVPPPEFGWNDSVAFRSLVLMDDAVLIEPKIGVRCDLGYPCR
jgi:hypothetical protein